MEHLKIRFLKVYANLPLAERKEVILKYDQRPMSWDAIYFEVTADSEDTGDILKELEKLEFI